MRLTVLSKNQQQPPAKTETKRIQQEETTQTHSHPHQQNKGKRIKTFTITDLHTLVAAIVANCKEKKTKTKQQCRRDVR